MKSVMPEAPTYYNSNINTLTISISNKKKALTLADIILKKIELNYFINNFFKIESRYEKYAFYSQTAIECKKILHNNSKSGIMK